MERLKCTPENPYKVERHIIGMKWEHSDTEELGNQEDGNPAGDIIKVRCKTCGMVWKEELPQ